MATITYSDGSVFTVGTGMTTYSPGSARKTVSYTAHAAKAGKTVWGTVAFDSSYPSGGEDIADIYNNFTVCDGVIFEQPIQAGAQTGKFARVDHANKKVQLFTNASPFAEVAGSSDQSAITSLKFIAFGV